MPDHDVKLLARQMRRDGKSLNYIMKATQKSKTTVWGWIRDIELSHDQKSKIKHWGSSEVRADIQRKATMAMVAKYAQKEWEEKERGRQFIKAFGDQTSFTKC